MLEIAFDMSIDTILEKIFDYRDENGLQVFSAVEILGYISHELDPDVLIPQTRKIKSVEEMYSATIKYLIKYSYDLKPNGKFDRGTSILHLTSYDASTTIIYADRSFSRQVRIGYEILKELLGFEIP